MDQVVNNGQNKGDLGKVAESILSGKLSLKDYYNITDDAVNAIYFIGHQMYANKKYDKASAIFSLVCMLSPTADNFYAQASANFMLKKYDAALDLYHMAMVFGKYSPALFEQMAECCAYLNKADLLQKYASESIRLSQTDEFKNNKTEVRLAERAKLMLNRLEELINSQKNKDSTK